MTGGLFAQSAYQTLPDPRDRVLAYIDLRAELLQGELPDFTCLLGTMVQETFDTHPRVRDACNAGIASHALAHGGGSSGCGKGAVRRRR